MVHEDYDQFVNVDIAPFIKNPGGLQRFSDDESPPLPSCSRSIYMAMAAGPGQSTINCLGFLCIVKIWAGSEHIPTARWTFFAILTFRWKAVPPLRAQDHAKQYTMTFKCRLVTDDTTGGGGTCTTTTTY